MKKISYRAVSIEKISVAMLVGLLAGAKKLVVSIDVAKTKMMAGFGREDGSTVRVVRFTSITSSMWGPREDALPHVRGAELHDGCGVGRQTARATSAVSAPPALASQTPPVAAPSHACADGSSPAFHT